ncbi:MAG: hypothetical protein QOG03_2676, partial [Actinomycetota bacterium]|nr:hypothetical protein [Actinomycetota bacterium]
SRDVRPADYATSFARQANHLSGIADPLTVIAVARPPWLAAVTGEPDVATGTLEEGLRRYSAV